MRYLCLILAVCTTPSLASAQEWKTTEQGQILLAPFKNAPYPHDSRKDGYTRNNTLYPADKHYSDSTIGIVTPTQFKPTEATDFIIHFHGHSNHVEKVISDFDLAAQLAKSKTNAILLVPQGPKDVPDSGGGKLEHDPGAFKAMIEEVAAFLVAQKKITTHQIGHLTLTSHSGGYLVTSAILQKGGLTDHITDVILFDSTYGGLSPFAQFVAENKQRRLISIFTVHLAARNKELHGMLEEKGIKPLDLTESQVNAKALQTRGVIFIKAEELTHNQVVSKKDWFELMVASRL